MHRPAVKGGHPFVMSEGSLTFPLELSWLCDPLRTEDLAEGEFFKTSKTFKNSRVCYFGITSFVAESSKVGIDFEKEQSQDL